MEIKIIIGEKTAKHLQSPHTFYDCCGEAEIVLRKIQKQINKKLTQKNRGEK